MFPPAQVSYPPGSINQIPGECTICGDCRVTPFYDIHDVMQRLREYTDDINANVTKLPTRGAGGRDGWQGKEGVARMRFVCAVGDGLALAL